MDEEQVAQLGRLQAALLVSQERWVVQSWVLLLEWWAVQSVPP
jgi:hypothetical protein